jgi:hypothetical protein
MTQFLSFRAHLPKVPPLPKKYQQVETTPYHTGLWEGIQDPKHNK